MPKHRASDIPPIVVHDSEDEDVRIIAPPNSHGRNDDFTCMFCDVDLTNWTLEDRQSHYDHHLSDVDALPPPSTGSRVRYRISHAKSSLTKGLSLLKPSAVDQFWYHSLESEPPSNYTPGLVPLLRRFLLNAVERGASRRAVLCYERAVHIYHEIWDAGWGCGYRNFMMLCAALVDQRMKPGYSPLLNNPTLPSVDNLKVWIEEAWKSGFDPEGAQGLNGQLVGHKKWIGTAELYVAFTYRGIPAQLADFNTPDGNVAPLLDWIKRYFDTHTQDRPTSVEERWRGATPVVISDRMPLILQHPGHSRTIVGYEISKDGGTTLLAFDPAIRMTQIRSVALSSFNLSKHRDPSNSKPSTARHVAGSPKKSLQSRSKCAGPSARRMESPPKRLRAGSIGDDVIIVEDPRAMAEVVPEPHRNGRGVMGEREPEVGQDEKALDPKRVLRLFRVDHKRLAKKDKYQVLWCPMEDPLTESDKQARREVVSDHVC